MNYEVRNCRHSSGMLVGVSTCRTSLIISFIISVQVGPTDNCARTLIQMIIVMKTSPAVLPSSGESRVAALLVFHSKKSKKALRFSSYFYYYNLFIQRLSVWSQLLCIISALLFGLFSSQLSMFSSYYYHYANNTMSIIWTKNIKSNKYESICCTAFILVLYF